MTSVAPIITFKAGICDFDISSNSPKIHPKPTPGYLYLYEGQDDELIHFCWRPRSTSLREPELDLVMVPGDGSFKPYQTSQGDGPTKKSPTNGRIFVLKFQSSSARHLFWLQSKTQHAQGDMGWFSHRDLKLGEIVDQLLQGEQVDVQQELNNVPSSSGEQNDDDDNGDRMEGVRRESQSGAAENLASGDPFIGDPSNEGEGSREGGADGGRADSMPSNDTATAVQNFLRSMQGNQALQNPQARVEEKLFTTLPDLLPSSTTIPVIDSAQVELVDRLLSQLPPDLMLLAQEVDDISSVDATSETVEAAMEALSLDQKKDILRKVLRSPQFQQSLSSLTSAIHDGGLPSIRQYLADAPPTIVPLLVRPHFEALTQEQKLYAHHVSRAAFLGTRIVLRQVSPESEAIFDFILALHEAYHGDWEGLRKAAAGVDDQDLEDFLSYATQFLGNGGNYKGFGDSKFIPRCPPETIEALATAVPKAKESLEKPGIPVAAFYATEDQPAKMHLGFPEKGHLSTYYPDSPDITQDEIDQISDFMAEKKLLPENTRLKKTKEGNFQLLIASGLAKPPPEGGDAGPDTIFDLGGNLKGKTLELIYGDHIEEMAKIALHIKKAGLNAANDRQKQMMDEYAKSFGSGSLEAFKNSQKLWVKDIGPMVETNIGFIETYRDPANVRAEWEGLVAMVNKERTQAFQKLVDAAPSMIPELPWGKDFEKDKFQAPDFTSLEVLTFNGSGIPAGINIPNYNDIRQEIGFKNVSLGNVLSAKAPNEPIPFIRPRDLETYQANRDQAFEVQVGIHELLGHGTGKLLQETEAGKFNFDVSNPPVSPVTNKPINTHYKPGQTWSSVFGGFSASYEECRAECVAMALSCDFGILKIFGFGEGAVSMTGKAGDVLYTSYLSMARAGVAAVEFWDPKSRKWGQAHMQARFSILKTFLDAGEGFTTLDYTKDDLSDLMIKVDREKILTVGRKAVEGYLQKLHVYKCTADYEAGKELYETMTHVDEWWATKVRPEVLRRKTPRKVFVQANTFEKDGAVELKEYEPTFNGMIQSWVERGV
ncbi:MAG: hypothetical protein Q9170_001752 [Blastenia crenularia]